MALLGVSLSLACAAPTPSSPAAPELAQRLGCWACHSLQGQGGRVASSLDGIGARLSPGQLQVVLTRPRQLHPGAKMPSYAYVPPEERQILVAFLSTLR